MSERVRVAVRGPHARLTFDDGRMNLLSHAGLEAIGGAFDSIRRVIDGSPKRPEAGPPVLLSLESGRPGLFAAGADMLEMRGFRAADAEAFSRKGQELFRSIECFPALTVVVIDGDCFGGALDFAMAFDVRLSTPRSRFSHPGGRIGIVTGFGGTSRWRSSAGPAAAGRLFLDSEVLSAREAEAIGLLHHVGSPLAPILRDLQSRTRSLDRLRELKSLASKEKNLGSLVLHARRLAALGEAEARRRKGSDGHSRDASRHLFR